MEEEKNAEARRDDVPKIQPLKKPFSITAISVLGLFILALFYTLYFARDFFLPVTMAWILSLLLKPLVRLLARVGLPPAIGSLIILISLAVVFATGLLVLSAPAAKWLERAPEAMDRIEEKTRSFLAASRLPEAAEKVEQMAGSDTDETPTVEIKQPGLLSSVWDQAKGTLVLGAAVLVLLYFLLAAGDLFILKLIQILPRLRDKKQAVEIARETGKGVSEYLLAVTLVNLFEGTVIGLGLWLIGLPNPLLWGVMAFFANYIPYLGAILAASVVTVAAAFTFDSLQHVLLAPAIYIGVNFMDNFISPYVVGRRLVLNPVIVFLAVMFWGWLWGIPGVLLAVPITVSIKIICDHTEMLAPFAEFLSAPREDKNGQS